MFWLFEVVLKLQMFSFCAALGLHWCERLEEEMLDYWDVVKELLMKEEWENLPLHGGQVESNLVKP